MTIRWQGYDWLTQERYGVWNPKKPLVWYDPDAVLEGVYPGKLHLLAHRNPRTFENGVTAPYGIGLVSCTEKFLYGHFEIEAKLPRTPHAWPAFWLWDGEYGTNNYAEIDVFEGYANKRGSYFRFGIPWWNVRANLYPPGRPSGAPFCWNPGAGFHKYVLDWSPIEIEIRYDATRILRRAVKIQQPMNLVINNSLRKTPPEPFMSDFVIRSFVYTK